MRQCEGGRLLVCTVDVFKGMVARMYYQWVGEKGNCWSTIGDLEGIVAIICYPLSNTLGLHVGVSMVGWALEDYLPRENNSSP
jgi:hypothetical protein